MKKIILALSVAAVATIGFYSCKKDVVSTTDNNTNNVFSEEIKSKENIGLELQEFYTAKEQYESSMKKALPPWLEKWIYNHSGRSATAEEILNKSCKEAGKCGPCPSICFRLGSARPIVDVDPISLVNSIPKKPLPEMISIIKISESKAIISFIDYKMFTMNNILEVKEDLEYPTSIAKHIDKKAKSFTIKKGVYPLSFEFNDKGETIVDIKLE